MKLSRLIEAQKDWDLPVDYTTLHWRERRSVREQYISEQGGVCMYCFESLEGPPSERVQRKQINHSLFPVSFFNHPIHLQHCHDTGMTEGAVHAKCNAVMWQYEGR